MLTKEQTKFLKELRNESPGMSYYNMLQEIIIQHGYKEKIVSNEMPTNEKLLDDVYYILSTHNHDKSNAAEKRAINSFDELADVIRKMQYNLESFEKQNQQLTEQRDEALDSVNRLNNEIKYWKKEYCDVDKKLNTAIEDYNKEVERYNAMEDKASEPYKTILTELVALKNYKEVNGSTDYYEMTKAILWKLAKSVCNG